MDFNVYTAEGWHFMMSSSGAEFRMDHSVEAATIVLNNTRLCVGAAELVAKSITRVR